MRIALRERRGHAVGPRRRAPGTPGDFSETKVLRRYRRSASLSSGQATAVRRHSPRPLGAPMRSAAAVRRRPCRKGRALSIDGTKALLTEHPFSALLAPSPPPRSQRGNGGSSLSFAKTSSDYPTRLGASEPRPRCRAWLGYGGRGCEALSVVVRTRQCGTTPPGGRSDDAGHRPRESPRSRPPRRARRA